MINPCSLRLELWPGLSHEEAAMLLLRMANKLDIAIVASFNGIDMSAYPGDMLRAVLVRFAMMQSLAEAPS